MKGKTIIFSGVDGAGKSTQIDLLCENLQAAGHKAVCIWSRGGYTPLFSNLKSFIRRLTGNKFMPASGPSEVRTETFEKYWVRRLWLLLAIVDLCLLYSLRIRLWNAQGKNIICDRYHWDTLIDFRLNFPQEHVEDWFVWRALVRLSRRPDVVFLLLISIDESLKRLQHKQEPFPEPPEKLQRRLSEYEKLAEQQVWIVLDGNRSEGELAETISRHLMIPLPGEIQTS